MQPHPLIVALERHEIRTAIATLKKKLCLTKLAPLSLFFGKIPSASVEIIWSIRGNLTEEARSELRNQLAALLASSTTDPIVHTLLDTPGQEVQLVIDRNFADYIASHGGTITVYEVREAEGRIVLSLQGSCSGCPSASMTLKFGVEAKLKEYFPWVKTIEALEPTPKIELDF